MVTFEQYGNNKGVTGRIEFESDFKEQYPEELIIDENPEGGIWIGLNAIQEGRWKRIGLGLSREDAQELAKWINHHYGQGEL